MADETDEITNPNPQAKAAKKSATRKPKVEDRPAAEVAPTPPPNILFGPSNSELNPAYAFTE